jgi:hypothetical protein
METIILTIFAFIVGYKVSSWIHAMTFKKILDDLGVGEKELRELHHKLADELGVPPEIEDRPSDKTVVEIKIEEHQGHLYAYEVEQDTFIAQGQTGDELLSRVMEKYPVNHRVICDRSNGGDLIADAVERRVKNT